MALASVPGEFAFVCQCEPYGLVPFLLLLPLLKRKRAEPAGWTRGHLDHIDGRTAPTEVQWSLLEDPVPQTDLLLVFGTYHHRVFGDMCNTLAEATNAAHWLGTTTEAVTANDHTIEPTRPFRGASLPRSVRPNHRGAAVERCAHAARPRGGGPDGPASADRLPLRSPILFAADRRMVDSLPMAARSLGRRGQRQPTRTQRLGGG